MGQRTNIEWCDSTVNPSTGCDGCELWNGRDIRVCYAGNLHEGRLAKSLPMLYAPDFQEVRLAPRRMMEAARWPDLRGKDRPDKPWLNGLPRMIFVGDMGDFMSKGVPDEYFENEILGTIKSPKGSRHFWLLLTKQIGRLADLSEKLGGLPDNCMAMTTVTRQQYVRPRVSDLLKVKCRWHGISAEPMWEEINLRPFLPVGGAGRFFKDVKSLESNGRTYPRKPQIDWVIIGGESEQENTTPKPFEIEWGMSLIEQGRHAGVRAFVKQLGSSPFVRSSPSLAGAPQVVPLKLRDPKGGDPGEWPSDLRVRLVPLLGREVR